MCGPLESNVRPHFRQVRRERVAAGLEEPRRVRMDKEDEEAREKVAKLAGNPVGRRALAMAGRKGVVAELSKGSTEEQIGKLGELVETGSFPDRKLKEAVMKKAPGEMDKAIKKAQRQGAEVTVDSLCREVKTEPGFLKMCERIGLSLEWFEDLARARMTAKGIGGTA